jgi:hypothetical protein
VHDLQHVGDAPVEGALERPKARVPPVRGGRL